ncbi:TVP38/TMEM64 family protein [Plantactinospora sp. GCM10030261]|uniref:TVP38/TMEM64 family protein n=1 Tax=Plantactinospora sp. GCM10030261 TaxID=3273420 RepID=UPI00361B7EB0
MLVVTRDLLTQRAGRRFVGLLLVVAGCGLGLLLLPPPDLATVPGLADSLGPAAPITAVLLGAALLVVLVPRTLITVAWGALFGPLQGAGYTLAAALLAALVGFGIGRTLGREFVAERVRGRLARLDGWFARQSVLGVITVRLLPVGGFGLVSYGYGTTGARLAPYLLGSVLASAPSAFGYAAIGAAVTSPGDINWLAVAPASFGLVASAILISRWWRAERRRRAASGQPAGETNPAS